MKIGMKGKMGVADETALSVLGLRAHIARYCAPSVYSELCEHGYLARSIGAR